MRILYFERDIAEARKCHAQLLAYKGIPGSFSTVTKSMPLANPWRTMQLI